MRTLTRTFCRSATCLAIALGGLTLTGPAAASLITEIDVTDGSVQIVNPEDEAITIVSYEIGGPNDAWDTDAWDGLGMTKVGNADTLAEVSIDPAIRYDFAPYEAVDLGTPFQFDNFTDLNEADFDFAYGYDPSGTGLGGEQTSGTVTFVPEPASIGLFGLGLGLALIRRRAN